MNNFDDPNEIEFTAKIVNEIKRAIIPGVGVALQIVTGLPPQAALGTEAPVYQILLTVEQSLLLADGLRHSAEAASQDREPSGSASPH